MILRCHWLELDAMHDGMRPMHNLTRDSMVMASFNQATAHIIIYYRFAVTRCEMVPLARIQPDSFSSCIKQERCFGHPWERY
jgi:hypothetical protein